MRGSSGSVQKIVKIKTPRRRRAKEDEERDGDEEEDEVFNEKYYIQALGSDNTEDDEEGVAGAAVFTFQKNKRSHGMAHTASELARTPGKSVTFSVSSDQEISPTRTTPTLASPTCTTPTRATPTRATPTRATPTRATPTRTTPTRATPTRATPTRATPTRATPTRATPTRTTPTRTTPTRASPTRATPSRAARSNNSESHTPQKGNKVQFVSTTPYRLRKRITIPNLRSDSDSELSPSDSGGEGEEEEDDDNENEEEEEVGDGEKTKKENKKSVKHPKTPSKTQAAALYKTPAKKSKNVPEPLNQPSLVEEYFEAHGSSKVLTSDRTLQRLNTPKLDRDTLFRLLENTPSCYSSEIQRLHNKYQKHFSKWMLQLQLGFSVLVYGLGSKKALLEDFRLTQLSQEIHLVVNGFFPSITLKSILNAITSEALEHQGTFRNPSDQIQYIAQTLKDSPDTHVYLLIHNIDGPMLRGEKTQSALGQLASIPNLHLIASIDHIKAPLVWDQCKQSQFNWLWWECVTFRRYAEETSYENSLLVQQTGALALSSLTHVLRSLTSNARGIFKLLVEFQLENKDNASYTGLSFQDFYQRCREAFLVNSDLTLRTQLTEFRDHKLIRTRKGADGVEYLLVPVETSTLMDFLEKEELE